jgi:hypothetical protein
MVAHASKKAPCSTDSCRGQAGPGSRYCNSCRYDREKAADPERVAYRHLKANVNTRNKRRAAEGRPLIKFSLTLEEFREFAIRHDYMLGRGRAGYSFHIDRMCDCDDGPGYCRSNIQVLPASENVTKENTKRRIVRQYDWQTKQAYWLKVGWQLALKFEAPPPF